MKYLIKNVKMPDDAKVTDILLEDSVIADIAENIEEECETLDAKGLTIIPALFDMHAHLREPGYEYKETIKSATMSAVKGGYTALVCLPDTLPVIDSVEMIDFYMNKLSREDLVDVYPAAAITMGLSGEYVSNIAELKSHGVLVCSDGMNGIQNTNLMRKAMQKAAENDMTFMVFCEDKLIKGSGLINDCESARKLSLLGIPESAENVMVARECVLSEETGARIHIMNVSTGKSVDLIRYYKKKGVNITCDVSVNNLLLSDGDIVEDIGVYNFNPPLRNMKDIKALYEGLKDGTIDHISCDHSPHHASEKLCPIKMSSCGCSGFETAFSLCYSLLVEKKILTLSQLIEKMSFAPRRILGLSENKIEKGSAATFCLADLSGTYVIDSQQFASLSKITPYNGMSVKGRIAYVFKEANILGF